MVFDTNSHIFRSAEFRGLVEDAVTFFNSTPVYTLPPSEFFKGSGVYGLYYVGDNLLYTQIANRNSNAFVALIYAGKAVPPGWRTARNPNPNAASLYARLQEHARSIQQGDGLNIIDFRCRFMIMNEPESDLITVVESELFRRYTPLWNSVVDGFGNHDPGKGRYNQAKSEWDILHPGRPWAEKLMGSSAQRDIIEAKIRQSFGNIP